MKKFERISSSCEWRCLKCGKIVKENGWAGHLRKHKDKIQENNKHIDNY